MKLTESFRDQAHLFLSTMQDSVPIHEIMAELRRGNVLASDISDQQFAVIFWAYLRAQATQQWNICCVDHNIDSKEIQNLFFRMVLDDYSEKKDIEGAANFSEAMYAANVKDTEEPLIAILAAFFRKIGVKDSISGTQIADLFRWLASIWEGYRNSFDNEFDDFVGQLRLRGNLRA